MLNEEKVILQQSLQLLQLQSTHDEAGLEALFDEDLEAVDADGNRLNKTEVLQQWLHTAHTPQNAGEIRISMFNDTALETGLLRKHSGEQEQQFCYSRLWVRHGNDWRLRGFQLTRRVRQLTQG